VHEAQDHRLGEEVEIANDVLERQRRITANHRRAGRGAHRLRRHLLHIAAGGRADEGLSVSKFHEHLDQFRQLVAGGCRS
jgi:hypothetical protein